jgi:adenylate cyclase
MSVEKNIAILMADLTGYTAMTEVHGALSAATIVEKYLELAHKAMFGKSRLLERVGDQLVIVSESPDDITHTALRLLEHTSAENNFLHIHGGLHFGPVLEQSGSFYGTSMNLTARIAAIAKRNSILCSVDFTKSVTVPHEFSFSNIGEVRMKNIKNPIALAELIPIDKNNSPQKEADPVCHMAVEATTPLRYRYKGVVYHFCSEDCLHAFRDNPEQVLQHQ